MPPTVARLDELTSGAKRRPCGLSAAFRSSSTSPGSTRAVRSSGFTSSTRFRYFDVSSTRPAPIDWPACEVPPPRGVIGTPWRAATRDGGFDVVARARQHHAERLDLIDAGVGGVERAGGAVEAHLAGQRVRRSCSSAAGPCAGLLALAARGNRPHGLDVVAAQRVDLVVEVHRRIAVRRAELERGRPPRRRRVARRMSSAPVLVAGPRVGEIRDDRSARARTADRWRTPCSRRRRWPRRRARSPRW